LRFFVILLGNEAPNKAKIAMAPKWIVQMPIEQTGFDPLSSFVSTINAP
jgi:hypothetical protein